MQVGLVNWLDLPDATTLLVIEELRLGISEISSEACTEFVAHSQGAAILSAALSYLTPAERARVCVTTIGPAAARFPAGLYGSRHVINLFDLFVAVPFGPLFAPETELVFFFKFPISHSAQWYVDDQISRRKIPKKVIIEAGR